MNFILSISVGVVKLTGPAATGKTRLLQQLETELQSERQETLLFLKPPGTIKELHDSISRQLRLNNEFGFNKALTHHILAKPYDQQRLVLVFDDAEKADIDVLLAIALFRNIMNNGQPIISIVLCGSEALNTKLEDASYRPLVQDMLLSYELNPLTREQLQAYGKACADIHRLGTLPLKNGVLTELLKDSKGLPGAVPELLKIIKQKAALAPPPVVEAPAPIAAKTVAAKAEAAETTVAAPAKPRKSFFSAKPKPVVEEAGVTAAVAETVAPEPAKSKVRSFFASKPKPEVAETVAEPVVAKEIAAEAVVEKAAVAKTIVAEPVVEEVVEELAAETVIDRTELSPDERLILESREEKEAASRFAFTVDWQRWKPALQGTAVAAGLLVFVVVGWPRVSPMVGRLYTSLTSSAPEPPTEVAVSEPEPAVVEEAPELVAEAPEPEPAVAEPAPAIPEPEPEPVQVATTTPAPAATAPAVTTPAVTAPAVPARIPGPTVTDASANELEMVIRDWLMAWQDQDVDNFFSYYHTDFAPLYQNTLADWRNDRQTRIARPASIMIELEDFMVGQTSRLGTRVSFWMTYETPTYADRTLKEVLIGPDVDGQWRILQEYNQQVAQVDAATFRAGLTVNQQTPAPQAATAAQGQTRTQIATSPIPLSAFPDTVQPPVVSSRASFSQDEIDEIARFLAAWLTAWQNQDTEDYFRYYMPDYKAASMASAEAWRNERITKINRPARIVLRMEDLQILAGDDDSVRVQLVLEYHSTHYADRTLKEIELQKATSGEWLITMEKNKEVEALPLMRLLPVDSLAFLF